LSVTTAKNIFCPDSRLHSVSHLLMLPPTPRYTVIVRAACRRGIFVVAFQRCGDDIRTVGVVVMVIADSDDPPLVLL
jgi:hypothetical protein